MRREDQPLLVPKKKKGVPQILEEIPLKLNLPQILEEIPLKMNLHIEIAFKKNFGGTPNFGLG